MKQYDEYLRIGDFDVWISSLGDYRIELNRAGDSPTGIWKGKFSGSESANDSTNYVTLYHKRGNFHYTFQQAGSSGCTAELVVPRLLFGKKIVHGSVNCVKAEQLYKLLQQI